jgi:hypothetical protein
MPDSDGNATPHDRFLSLGEVLAMGVAETRPCLGPFLGPFLSRFSTQMDKKLGFEGQKRLKDHHQRRTRWLQHHPHL